MRNAKRAAAAKRAADERAARRGVVGDEDAGSPPDVDVDAISFDSAASSLSHEGDSFASGASGGDGKGDKGDKKGAADDDGEIDDEIEDKAVEEAEVAARAHDDELDTALLVKVAAARDAAEAEAAAAAEAEAAAPPTADAPATDDAPDVRASVTLTYGGTLQTFDADKWRDAHARALGVPTSDIAVDSVRAGSVIVDASMPAKAADGLWEKAASGELEHALAKALDCWFPLLAVESARHDGVVAGDGTVAPKGATSKEVAASALGRYEKRAGKLQASHRGAAARRESAAKRERATQSGAAAKLQAAERGRATRRERAARTGAATTLQAKQRSRLARASVAGEKANRAEARRARRVVVVYEDPAVPRPPPHTDTGRAIGVTAQDRARHALTDDRKMHILRRNAVGP